MKKIEKRGILKIIIKILCCKLLQKETTKSNKLKDIFKNNKLFILFFKI